MRFKPAGILAGVAAMVAVSLACARDGNAEPPVSMIAADDTAAVGRILRAVRGSDPFLCELAVRHVDMHGWWSRWGPLGGDPLQVDSSAADLIAWVQRKHSDPAVVGRLRTAMRDTDGCVRRVGASILARVDHATARAALLEAIDDPRAETRQVAALALGMAEMPEALQPLIRRLKDDSPAVRRAAAWSLGTLEKDAALESLIDLVGRDTDPQVRQVAAWALGRISG